VWRFCVAQRAYWEASLTTRASADGLRDRRRKSCIRDMLIARALLAFVSWHVWGCEPLSQFLPSDISIETRIKITVFFDVAERRLQWFRITIPNYQIAVAPNLQHGS